MNNTRRSTESIYRDNDQRLREMVKTKLVIFLLVFSFIMVAGALS